MNDIFGYDDYVAEDKFKQIYEYAIELQSKYGIGKRFVELLYLLGYYDGKEGHP